MAPHKEDAMTYLFDTLEIEVAPELIAVVDAEPTVRALRAIRGASKSEPEDLALTICAVLVRRWIGDRAIREWPDLGAANALALRIGVLSDLPQSVVLRLADACSGLLAPSKGDEGKSPEPSESHADG